MNKFKNIPNNRFCEFHSLNQGDKKFQQYLCTLFAPAINLKYNCGIELTEDDIETIANRQLEKGLIDLKLGGKGSDGVEAVYNFLKDNPERFPKLPSLIKFKKYEVENINNARGKGFAIMVGMGVTKEFSKDSRDGKITKYTDYKKYKGSEVRHFTNFATWKNKESEDYNKTFVIDSYFKHKKREWIYSLDVVGFIDELIYPSCYVFCFED